MLELQRRQALRYLNKTAYWNIPLIHAIVFLIELVAMSRLIAKFNESYDKRPLVTMMVSNAILGGLADTTAQLITGIRERAARKPGGPNADEDPIAIEIHELDKAVSNDDLIPNSPQLPPPFDFARLSRFMGYGFAMAPLQFKWFKFLSSAFPIGPKYNAVAQTAKRVACDQLLFAPAGLVIFYSAMTLAEGGNMQNVKHKLRNMYVPTLKANYTVWPAVQLINFRLMPVQFQLPFVSTVGIAWTAYLSLSNAAADVRENDDSDGPGSGAIRLG